MSNRNLLSDGDKELFDMAERFEKAQNEGKHIYMDADDWADLADYYATHKKADKAFEAIESGLMQHPGNTAILVEQAYLYLDDNQLETALQIANSIEESDTAEVKILKATLYLRKGEDWKTNDLLEGLENTDSLANIIEIAYMYIEAGSPDLALPWLNSVNERHKKNEAYLSTLADYYFAVNEIDECQKLFNQLIDINPYSAPYWFGLSRCYMCKEQYHKVIEAAEFAIVADEEYGEAYLIMSNAYFFLGNEEKGMEYFTLAQKYHAIEEELGQTVNALKMTDENKWEEAFISFQQTLKNEDLSTQHGKSQANILYASMAQCLSKMGDRAQAYECCQKGIEADPTYPDAYIIYGCLLIEDKQYSEGKLQWEKADNLSPTTTTWWQIGTYAQEYGMLDMALLYFEKVVNQNPEFPSINEQLAIIYLFLQNEEKFLEYNQRAEQPLTIDYLNTVQKIVRENNQNELADSIQRIIDHLNNH